MVGHGYRILGEYRTKVIVLIVICIIFASKTSMSISFLFSPRMKSSFKLWRDQRIILAGTIYLPNLNIRQLTGAIHKTFL